MNVQTIFLLQFVLSLATWALIAAWLLAPRLATLPRNEALLWLTLPHAFRHLGMVFLVPGVVHQPLPAAFAGPAAYGDLMAGVLALLVIIAMRANWRFAMSLAWVFSAVGIVDLLNALRHIEAVPNFGATWYIPTFVVPLLLVTHVMIVKRLLAARQTNRVISAGVRVVG